jgi:endonuclease-3
MAKLDAKQREKWPAPSPGPDRATTQIELDKATAEARQDPLRAKARAVLALLREDYGEPNWPILDPLGTLIETVLSHRTADPQTWAAYNELRNRFPTWEQVLNASVEEIDDAIGVVTFHEQKAPRIKAILRRVSEEHGSFDLDFLRTMPLDEANAWLQSLGGVGPKTAACVLLFSCKRPILPVDTHVHRVSIRLGLIGPKVSADNAHQQLLDLLPEPNNARDVLAFHRDMLLHGQRICVWSRPKCERCVLRDWCDYYAALVDKPWRSTPQERA